jgi:hypothetical protein
MRKGRAAASHVMPAQAGIHAEFAFEAVYGFPPARE